MDDFPNGVVHQASLDLQVAIRSDPKVFERWAALTALGRNEFICWVDDAKQAKTRLRRIERTSEELLEGKKRPCCWVGCIHRTDKAPSRWQQAVLIDRKPVVRSPGEWLLRHVLPATVVTSPGRRLPLRQGRKFSRRHQADSALLPSASAPNRTHREAAESFSLSDVVPNSDHAPSVRPRRSCRHSAIHDR